MLRIKPATDGTFTVQVNGVSQTTGVTGAPLADAVVTAVVRGPSGSVLATGLTLTSSAGVYTMSWSAAWTTDAAGHGREGPYTVVITTQHAGLTSSDKFPVTVAY